MGMVVVGIECECCTKREVSKGGGESVMLVRHGCAHLEKRPHVHVLFLVCVCVDGGCDIR